MKAGVLPIWDLTWKWAPHQFMHQIDISHAHLGKGDEWPLAITIHTLGPNPFWSLDAICILLFFQKCSFSPPKILHFNCHFSSHFSSHFRSHFSLIWTVSKCAFIFKICFNFQNVLSFSKCAFILGMCFHFRMCFHFQYVLPFSRYAFIFKMSAHFQNML